MGNSIEQHDQNALNHLSHSGLEKH